MLKFFKRSFITGLVLAIPIGVVVFLTDALLKNIGGPASKVLFGWLNIGTRYAPAVEVLLNLISILVVLLSIVIIGCLSNFFIGKLVISSTEKLINRVPFIGSVYKTIKQIIEIFGKGEKSAFSKVVLIEFPRNGSYALGFLASEASCEAQTKTKKNVSHVFVPTAPNPTSGFLLIIPKDDIMELNMSVSDGMKLILSGGMVVPQHNKKQKDKNG